MSEQQYDERDELSVETTDDAPADDTTPAAEAADEPTADEPTGAGGLAPGESPDPELEAQYGEPDEGLEVEDIDPQKMTAMSKPTRPTGTNFSTKPMKT